MQTVAALIFDPVSTFETGVACEVYGLDRSDMGVPQYRFLTCSPDPMPLRTKDGGFHVHTDHGLAALRKADIVIVPGWAHVDREVSADVCVALRRVWERGGKVVSFCSGAFVLAAAGLLDGRRAATHWMYADLLAERFPAVDVDASVLYVDDGSGVYTSAGTAAAVDLCLHLVRQEHGAAVANVIARRMVMPPHREGGQAQYAEAPPVQVEEHDLFTQSLSWAASNLNEDLTVERWAAKAGQSPRTFARHFRQRLGTTPLQWLLHQRVIAAQQLLETTALPIEHVASHCGFGTAATLRQHFARVTGTSPQAYRRTFQTAS